jgi:hypothetical protein
MEILEFSHNWNNKLDCDIFSTIRLWDPKKHYPGKVVRIFDNSTKPATIKGTGKYEIVSRFTLNELKPAIALLDTGYNLEETKNILRKMYTGKVPNVETVGFAYIIIKKIKETATQSSIFNK